MSIHHHQYLLRSVVLLGALSLYPAVCRGGDAWATGVWYEGSNQAQLRNIRWDGEPHVGNSGAGVASCVRATDSAGSIHTILPNPIECYAENVFLGPSMGSRLLRQYLGEFESHRYIRFSQRPDDATRVAVRLWMQTNSPGAGGSYDVLVKIDQWEGLPSPASCSMSAGAIQIGSVRPDETRTAGSTLTIKCNADTGVTVTVGGRDGSAEVPYTPGGAVRMSFAESPGGGSNVYRVHANKNQSIDATVRATTVPGSAAPGTYTASAVVTADLQ